jgi:uncharacterized membrane protein YedE/YeeE
MSDIISATREESIPASSLDSPSGENGRNAPAALQTRAIAIGALASALFIAYLGSTQGAAKATLGAIGLGLGVTLFHSRFGFTSAWRQLVSVGQGRALQAHMLMLAVAVVAFSVVISGGTGLFGTTPGGFVAPITVALLIGAALFGIGMQLGGSCASGTLFATGSGHLGVVITLTGFIVGSGLGVAGWSFWTSGSGYVQLADPFSFTDRFGAFGGTLALVAVIGAVAGVAELVIRRRRPPQIEQPPTACGLARILRGSWPIWVGAIVLALLNTAVLLVTGRPWGVTFAFRLWASKILDGIGVDVASWSFWNLANGPRPGLAASVFADNTSVASFGIILGALVASAAAGSFAAVRRIPGKTIAAGLIGGIMMGYGATFAAGCNIGAYFSGIASGSIHGWVWAVMALAGTWIGLKLRPVFGLNVPKPTDSSC